MPKKEMRITVVSYLESIDEEFEPPTKYYFRNASGELVFLHTRSRDSANQYVKDEWEGKYQVRCSGLEKTTKNLTVTGTATRKGQKKY